MRDSRVDSPSLCHCALLQTAFVTSFTSAFLWEAWDSKRQEASLNENTHHLLVLNDQSLAGIVY